MSRTRFQRLGARHVVFKIGWAVGIFATIVFIVGFSAAAWDDKVGLWLDCSNGCNSTTVDSGPSWLDAVRAMECLALIAFAVALFAELYQDVCKRPPPADNMLVEGMYAFAGTLGIIGVAIYGAKITRGSEYKLHWGYGLTVAGSGLAFICACLMAISRIIHREETEAAVTAAGFTIRPCKNTLPMHHMYPAGAAGTQATSQVPVFYIMNQGVMVPVYGEMPTGIGEAKNGGSRL